MNYVPKREGCILDFMLHNEFVEVYSIRDRCKSWTPYWGETLIEGGHVGPNDV